MVLEQQPGPRGQSSLGVGREASPLSRWDEDVLHNQCCTGKCVKNTASEWNRVKQQGSRLAPRASASDVERPVSRSHVAHPDQEDVDQRPDAQASEAEQFPQTFSPLAQVKAVGSKASQRDAAGEEEHEQS